MNNKEWNIRKAVIQDTEGLTSCMEQAYAVYTDRLEGQHLPPMNADYEAEIKTYPVWVVEYEGQVVGGLILQLEQEYVQVANVAIRPDFQGKGLGKRLMDFAEQEANTKGYQEMRLATHVKLTENVAFYQRLGWVEVDRDDLRVYLKKSLNRS